MGLAVNLDLTVVWAFLIAFAVFAYVVLDGFDLGLGMLFAIAPEERDRDVMMNSVAPVWDGNETWLVLGGGGLFAAFPLAYALVMPALYAPIIAMLLALIFRGVAFEFRWRTVRWRGVWDLAFIAGSSMASFAQGVALGALLQGIEVDMATRSYAGGWFDWLTPFSVVTGVAVMAGYCLLGATWLVMKTEGDLQDRMRRIAWLAGLATLAFIGLVSAWTPFLQDGYYNRWFTGWGIGLAVLVAGAVLLVAWRMFHSLNVHRHEYRPFLQAIALFALCFVGLGICMWPYVVPVEVTIWDAAAPEKSQMFMLVGALVLVPLILAYTAYAYWTFRGKIDPEAGYH
ncbi:cytochrome d ubiquinol oxidase subunit II [Aquibium oceanicum]|uniref:Cytochrome d ubiquinol oxidase subunit II n=1 Tax=Aquibium oceanicum TaxID=1670800 RepID=A0A1L3SYY1_9HYPH|nr:cytochrome d ubiquinol oxidase subunit II [Aquibium oceanicum]APH74590.1 cytochrome d ubiquinol oxidase subunit II [Aquibium oceanicum]